MQKMKEIACRYEKILTKIDKERNMHGKIDIEVCRPLLSFNV